MRKPMPSLLRKTASLVLAVLVSLTAAAIEPVVFDQPVAFDQLDAAEQRVLMPFAESWSTLPVQTQQNLRLGAQRWNALSAEDKRATAQRLKRRNTVNDCRNMGRNRADCIHIPMARVRRGWCMCEYSRRDSKHLCCARK